MATITVRRLDSNWDVVGGNGLDDFLTDGDAVAQIIRQRLLLFKGEWWEDQTLGIPLFQSILGSSRDIDTVTGIYKEAILAAPYVTGVSNLAVAYDSASRSYSYSCDVQTVNFGTLTISS